MRAACRTLRSSGPRAMIYLAAAVSDFFIPEADMAADKIQSSAAGLNIQLANVPKLLGMIKKTEGAWAPEAFLVCPAHATAGAAD